MSDFNLPLLRKAVEWAESEARKPVEESEWSQLYFETPGWKIDRACSTAYCIAGYIAHVIANDDDRMYGDTEDFVARSLLGISYDDAWDPCEEGGLFRAGNSIEDVRRIAEQIARKYGEEL